MAWGLDATEELAGELYDTTENAERIKLEKANLVAKNREEGNKMFLYGSLGVVLAFIAIFAIVGVARISLPSMVFIVPGTMCGLTAFWGAANMRSK